MRELAELNESQFNAVTTIHGPVMIIAGPGSGKTRVLTFRIAYLIKNDVDPFRIMALTFTNKAAAEMRERISHIVGSEAKNLYMGTFHSVFARILRAEAHRLGYPNNFTIYDPDDAKSLLKSIIREEGLNDKLYKPATVYYRISGAKNALIDAKKYAENTDLVSDDESSGRPKIAELFAKYQDRCFKAGAMDFDDLLLKTYELLTRFPDVLYKYQKRFTHVLIDEFQDTNNAQYEIVKLFAAQHENVCVVGDDAQSIYAFRGATIENILNFERDYPDLKVFKLEQNYRSTEHIVQAANDIIKHNKAQLPKKIWTEQKGGEKIKVYKTASDTDEARIVADSIFDQKMRQHLLHAEFAILYRTNAQSRSFEEALRRLNIPYKIYGGLSFYQRKEVKDFIAYLRVTVNPNDEEALKRIINYPVRGIGNTSIDRLIVTANEYDLPLWHVAEKPEIIQDMQGRAKQAIRDFSIMIKSFRAMLPTKNAYEIAEYIGRQTGIVQELFKDKTAEGISRYENIQELLNGIKEYTVAEKPEYEEDEVRPENDLAAYLQQISLLTDMDDDKDENKDRVKLMTIHAAKGLEFTSVFIVGLEENLFPSIMAMNTREDLEEERRLFYVAVTRSKRFLTLSYALTRYKFGQLNYCDPSRFIEEIADSNKIFFGQKEKPKAEQKPLFDNDSNSKWYLSKQYQKKEEPVVPKYEPPKHLTKIKAAAGHTASITTDLQQLQAGMKVLHEKFNQGKVLSVEGSGENKIATIFFEGVGNKKIMLKFAKLQILE
ncbi:MAG: UvrD-helicase domain-containing protein [Sphingobacteriales bacterium]|nr:UvrD-helicase domain-containing protein [Sphingobacteriales bacterium]